MSNDDDSQASKGAVASNGVNGAAEGNGAISPDDPRVTPLGGNAGVHIQAEPEDEDDEEPMIDFGGFIVGLGTSCMINLGKQDHPETGTRQLDLPSAEEVIAILEMLQEKTRGNLDREEEQLLTALLRDLKSAYDDVS